MMARRAVRVARVILPDSPSQVSSALRHANAAPPITGFGESPATLRLEATACSMPLPDLTAALNPSRRCGFRLAAESLPKPPTPAVVVRTKKAAAVPACCFSHDSSLAAILMPSDMSSRQSSNANGGRASWTLQTLQMWSSRQDVAAGGSCPGSSLAEHAPLRGCLLTSYI
ncbi:hypothetical protein P153DRAFT_99415 [Dothidotthia symphoricarpi CBS 119687]|uniref:Uncharacterized protein n=1 Tax=Dothidotthia symphoricarpi CBS 119687 TaxID=1392245 RepID=A0A6A6ARL8_9PLEO|nr:uncharacterized protein P153DRAFT_99415 [Dothidotthia symphoricarpi CBS 119687]KAF2133818.1 hypothetical protein P153DRAFT_99415 [Dothidotthia symphoricarpi CBS 119687]